MISQASHVTVSEMGHYSMSCMKFLGKALGGAQKNKILCAVKTNRALLGIEPMVCSHQLLHMYHGLSDWASGRKALLLHLCSWTASEMCLYNHNYIMWQSHVEIEHLFRREFRLHHCIQNILSPYFHMQCLAAATTAIEICDRMKFYFYTRLPQLCTESFTTYTEAQIGHTHVHWYVLLATTNAYVYSTCIATCLSLRQLAAGIITYLDSEVLRAGDDQLVGGAHGTAGDLVLVALEVCQHHPSGRIPQLQRVKTASYIHVPH